MKKIILIFTLFISSFTFSQSEIKLDIADALVIRSLEFSYESYLSEESSFGISALFNLAKQDVDFRYNENVVITPFVRHYFSTESLWNFFGELFLAYNTGDQDSVVNGFPVSDNYSDGALGLAVGYKYISPGGFTVDIHGGAGRNLFSKESPRVVPRIGVNIGYQF